MTYSVRRFAIESAIELLVLALLFFVLYLITLVGDSIRAGSEPPVAERSDTSSQPALGITSKCRIVEWYDGDTLTVEIPLRARIRLLDCWAPELKGDERAEGLKSLKFARSRWPDGSDAVIYVPTDNADRLDDVLTFGRVLGRVYVNGVDISTEIVESGHATKEKQ